MSKWIRFAPLTGVVFVVLLGVAFGISGSTPGAGDSGQHVIQFFTAHRGKEQAANFLSLYAVVFFLFFAATLRGHFRLRLGDSALPALSFGAAVLVAVGG